MGTDPGKLDLGVVTTFLQGKLSIDELSVLGNFRAIDRALVVWSIALALPEEYMHPSEPNRLRMPLDRLCWSVFPTSATRGRTVGAGFVSTSKSAGLHDAGRGQRARVTVPQALRDLVKQYKDNPDGGIAKFIADREKAAAEAAALKAQEADKAQTDKSEADHAAALAALDPFAVTAAQDLLERLRKTYTDDALTALKYLI